MKAELPEMETLTYEQDEDGIGLLQFNRPEKLNAWTSRMWEEMGALGEMLQHDSSVRAVIVSGKGRAFSSGIDTSVFAGGTLDVRPDSTGTAARHHEHPVTNMIMSIASTYVA